MKSVHTNLEKYGVVVEEVWMGAATGEFQTIFLVILSGVAGGFLGAIGQDLWEKIKTFLQDKYKRMEKNRIEKEKTTRERKRLRCVYIVGKHKDVPILYFSHPKQNALPLSIDKGALSEAENDIALLIHANKLKANSFFGINLDNLGLSHYLRMFDKVPSSELDIMVDITCDAERVQIYTHALAGMYFEDIDEDKRSARHYEIAAENKKNDAALYVNIGIVYSRIYGLEKGKEAFKKSLDIDGDKAKYHYNVGCIQAQSGNVREAMEELRLAIEHGYRNVGEMTRDPDLFALRSEPAFVELLTRLKGLLKSHDQ